MPQLTKSINRFNRIQWSVVVKPQALWLSSVISFVEVSF
jgi:hypothetical protein